MANEKLTRSIEGKKPYVLNLDNSMTSLNVRNSEQMICEIEIQKQHLMPKWNDTKSFYEEAKKEFDSVNVQMQNLDEQIN